MPGTDRKIDPITRDYIEDAALGTTETTESAETAIFHQYVGTKDSWPLDPDAGLEADRINRAKSGPNAEELVDDTFIAALQPLVEAGYISQPTTEVERLLDRVVHATEVFDLQTSTQLDLTQFVPNNQ